MSRFTPAEIEYLQSQRLGRLATVNERGDLHVVPVGFRYNPDEDTLDLGGHDIVSTRKYREALRHGRVAFVIDDAVPGRGPRFVEVRGTARAVSEGGKAISSNFAPAILRITPTYIVSLGVNDEFAGPAARPIPYHGRRVE
ncbi:MAG TPA: PPOX class F420-dependent oxidoreductase [Ktedonobacterales bacterium]|nr:PPOX class F420-dependent oxidoreductase [Ktedonobacterales bacterium]